MAPWRLVTALLATALRGGLAQSPSGSASATTSVSPRSPSPSAACISGAVATIAGNFYIPGGFADGAGTAALFSQPVDVAIDGFGRLFIADAIYNAVRVADVSTGSVRTLTGGNSGGYADGNAAVAKFNTPSGVDVDNAGSSVYVAEHINSLIRTVTVATGVTVTLAGGGGMGSGNYGFANGVGTQAVFNNPAGIALNPSDTVLYVADVSNHMIRAIVIATRSVTTLAGGGPLGGSFGYVNGVGTAARFYGPSDVAVTSAGTVFVADKRNSVLRAIDISTGATTTLAGWYNYAGAYPAYIDGIGNSAVFNSLSSLAVGMGSDLIISDSSNSLIRVANMTTGMVTTLSGGNCTTCRTSSGSMDGVGWGAGFNYPTGIAVDGAGVAYVSDSSNNLIRAVDVSTGVVTSFAGGGSAGGVGSGRANGAGSVVTFNYPTGLDVDGAPGVAASNIYVADNNNHLIRAIAVTTRVVSILGGGTSAGSTDGLSSKFNFPTDVACDTSSGRLYVADSGNNLIRSIVISTKSVSRFAGGGSTTGLASGFVNGIGSAALFDTPIGIALDGSSSILYVAEYGNSAIRAIAISSRAVTLLAGGSRGYADGFGTTARFLYPYGIDADGSGSIFIGGTQNDAIRVINISSTQVSTLAGLTTSYNTPVDGIGSMAKFDKPFGVSVDGSGKVYVSDASSNLIRAVTAATGAVTTLAGGYSPNDRGVTSGFADGFGTAAAFFSPGGVALDTASNIIYVADPFNNVIRAICPSLPQAASSASVSMTPSVSTSAKPTSSISSSASVSGAAIVASSSTTSSSVSPTNSGSIAASATASSSTTPSNVGSVAATATLSPTVSPSASDASAAVSSLSASSSVSPTKSGSIAASATASSSMSSSNVSSVAATATLSPTVSPSASKANAAASESASATVLPSLSNSVTDSMSNTMTSSVTRSVTCSVLSSVSRSVTRSVGESLSSSASLSPSATASRTSSVAVSGSATPSMSQTWDFLFSCIAQRLLRPQNIFLLNLPPPPLFLPSRTLFSFRPKTHHPLFELHQAAPLTSHEICNIQRSPSLRRLARPLTAYVRMSAGPQQGQPFWRQALFQHLSLRLCLSLMFDDDQC